uniref:Uncharacterized protein n=1 Tax=Lepeophtheirus salmonis TaxID=72036 RepID=A0A0K2VKI2_LEPSM
MIESLVTAYLNRRLAKSSKNQGYSKISNS